MTRGFLLASILAASLWAAPSMAQQVGGQEFTIPVTVSSRRLCAVQPKNDAADAFDCYRTLPPNKRWMIGIADQPQATERFHAANLTAALLSTVGKIKLAPDGSALRIKADLTAQDAGSGCIAQTAIDAKALPSN